MADALGIGAGVLGVISLTIQIMQVVTKFGKDWKDTPDSIRVFMTELDSLNNTLSRTYANTVASLDFTQAFEGKHSLVLSELEPKGSHNTGTKYMIDMCAKELGNLLIDLKKRSQGHRLGWERIKGAFSAKEIVASMQNLSRKCQILNEMLVVDMTSMVATINVDVKAGRKEQQEWHQANTKIAIAIQDDLNEATQRQERREEEQERQKILNWLTEVDYTSQQNDYLGRRQEGTGQWLLESTEFSEWLHTEQNTLFCPGIPGAGKTILAASVIDHIAALFQTDMTVGIAYVFCNFRQQEHQTALDLLQSLLEQLLQRLPSLPLCVKTLHQKHNQYDTRPTISEISSILQSVVAIYSRVFIVVDALDECKDSSDYRAGFLKAISNLQGTGTVKFLATSRPNLDIESQFEKSLRREILASDEDIRRYVHGNMPQSPAFFRRTDLQEDIKSVISGTAKGM